ncbi:MAG: hypothetical protein IPP40_09495 [bacterium]|nr:hypothetical protein [bacterium]
MARLLILLVLIIAGLAHSFTPPQPTKDEFSRRVKEVPKVSHSVILDSLVSAISNYVPLAAIPNNWPPDIENLPNDDSLKEISDQFEWSAKALLEKIEPPSLGLRRYKKTTMEMRNFRTMITLITFRQKSDGGNQLKAYRTLDYGRTSPIRYRTKK